MIIPIKCFTCGNVLASRYRYYLEEVRKLKQEKDMDGNQVVYLTKLYNERSPEAIVMDNIGITRICCRRHYLTHVDID